MKIVVAINGNIRYIHSDDLIEMGARLGFAVTKRASFVEPGRFTDGVPRWFADMAPVGGPMLGPFATRAEALDRERLWIDRYNVPAVRPVKSLTLL